VHKKGFKTQLGALVIAVILSIALLYYVAHQATGVEFWQNYLSRDTALVIDTLSGADGDVKFTYSQISQLPVDAIFLWELPIDHVRVYDAADEEKEEPVSFPLGRNKHLNYPEIYDFVPFTFYLAKQDAEITVTPQQSTTGCSAVNTHNNIATKVYTFLSTEKFNPLRIDLGTKLRLIHSLPSSNIQASWSGADVIFVFQEEEITEMKAYYLASHKPYHHQKFICLLQNELGTPIKAIPVNLAEDVPGFPYSEHALSEGELAIYFIIPESVDAMSLSAPIFDSLERYYG